MHSQYPSWSSYFFAVSELFHYVRHFTIGANPNNHSTLYELEGVCFKNSRTPDVVFPKKTIINSASVEEFYYGFGCRD